MPDLIYNRANVPLFCLNEIYKGVRMTHPLQNKSKKPEKHDTNVLPKAAIQRRAEQSANNADGKADGTSQLGEHREIILQIRGTTRRLMLTESTALVLGRTDVSVRFTPDIDLTPYGGADRGVSRAHAKLHLVDKRLFLTDLGSTNGTFVDGKRLDPNSPVPVRQGDEIIIGKLAIGIQFGNSITQTRTAILPDVPTEPIDNDAAASTDAGTAGTTTAKIPAIEGATADEIAKIPSPVANTVAPVAATPTADAVAPAADAPATTTTSASATDVPAGDTAAPAADKP
jgi:pSer/pThr/pTyr-binding forkhead associated (FHA) protein